MNNNVQNISGEIPLSEDRIQEEQNSRNKRAFIRAVILLNLLYLIQGFLIGYFEQAIEIILISHGAKPSQIAFISLIKAPFSFKILFAPFMDIYFSSKFGQRKSYIVPIHYTMGLSLLLWSFTIDKQVANLEINYLSVFGVGFGIMNAMQDVAVDGWVVTLLPQDKLQYGAICQSLGQSIGQLLSGSVFVLLNSVDFCNENIYSEPRNHPLLTSQRVFVIMGIIIIAINIVVHFCQQEKGIVQEFSHPLEVIKLTPQFLKNIYLRKLLIMYLIWQIGIKPIQNGINFQYIKKNFNKEMISEISTSQSWISIVASLIPAFFLQNKKDLTVMGYLLIIRLFQQFYEYFIVLRIDPLNPRDMYLYVFIAKFFDNWLNTFKFVAQNVLPNRIADPPLGATYITLFRSFINLGFLWSNTATLFLMDYIQYNYLVYGGWILQIILLIFLTPWFKLLESLPQTAFLLEYRRNQLMLQNQDQPYTPEEVLIKQEDNKLK